MATKTKAQPADAAAAVAGIEKIAAKAKQTTRVVRKIEAGQFVRQGDVYAVRIKAIPSGLKETQERQLAPGNTQGSRHVLAGQVKVWARDNGDSLTGPVFEVLGKSATLTHPEHAHIDLPTGCYEVRFQEDLSTKRAVAD